MFKGAGGGGGSYRGGIVNRKEKWEGRREELRMEGDREGKKDVVDV